MKTIAPNHAGAGLRIGIAMARFNEAHGKALLKACLAALKDAGVAQDAVTLVSVPGALELPLALQRLAQQKRFDALIALGCVVRGETYHFEIVANESARGLMDVQLETGIPIANAVLTVQTDEQADARVNEKGADAAKVAVEMAQLMRALPLGWVS